MLRVMAYLYCTSYSMYWCGALLRGAGRDGGVTTRYGAVVLYLVYHVTLRLYCTCYSTLRCRSIAPFTARYGAAARFCAV